MGIRRPKPEEYAAAGRVTALAYQEFAPPGDAEWDQYLRDLADVAGRADRTELFVASPEKIPIGRAHRTRLIEGPEPAGPYR